MPSHSTSISVLMAVRNGMPYLPAAVESILSQTFTDFEFLIIDDHSTDMSPGYLDSLKDPRVRILPNPGKGLTAALNFGLQQSKGEWIARMDADDWSFPTRLAQQYDAAKKPDVVLISANYVVCDEDLNPAGEIRLSQPNEKLFSYLREKNNPFCHPVMMFNRRAAKEVGGYRYERAQDYDLWIRLLEKGKLAHVDDVLLKYRVSKLGISIRQVDEQSRSREAIQNQDIDPGLSGSTTRSGQYEYRLGFAAWLAGNRVKAAYFFMSSISRGNNVLRCLIALILMAFPRNLYLGFAGYRGVYKS